MLLIPPILCLLGLSLGTAHAAAAADGACPASWSSFYGSCYKYVPDGMTWAAAELNCVSQDANLVSIHRDAEHSFVRTLIKNHDPREPWTWIGLSDTQMEGGWMWSDGSKVSFPLWSDGNPDNYGGNEDCVHTNWSTKWNDVPCATTLPSVCKSRTVQYAH